MAPPQPRPPEPLPPDFATRLSEFAKACKAATRVVSMYPPSHPTIQAALSRITAAGKQLLANGPVAITVLPDALLVGGRGFAKPDAAAGELAALLHLQLIGELTLLDPLDNDDWHAFLMLLARSPEDARAAGGLAQAWSASGNSSITLKEIDYAEVLARARRQRRRRRRGTAFCRPSRTSRTSPANVEEPAGMAGMLEMAKDSDQLAQFADRLQDARPGQRRRFGAAAQVAARADARPGQLRRRAAARRTGCRAEPHGRRRGADVARHAADADHRSAAAAAARRHHARHGPRRRVAGAPDRRDADQVPRRERREGPRRQQPPGGGVPDPGARPEPAAGHPRRRHRAGPGAVRRRTRSSKACGPARPRC